MARTEGGRGRPTKYDPIYCDQMIEFMSKGYSYTAFAGHIGVNVDTLQEWSRNHRDFSVAKSIAEAACEKTLISIGHGLITGRLRGNATPWVFMMKNICKWKDRTDLEISGPTYDEQHEHDIFKAIPRKDLLKLAKKVG